MLFEVVDKVKFEMPHKSGILNVIINQPQEINDLKEAINRALNTWDKAPAWLFKLSDILDGGLKPGEVYKE